MTRRHTIGLIVLGIAAAAGCGPNSRKRIVAPAMSPSSAAADAMALYDVNKDGFLDAAELEKCPALKVNLKKYDTNGDGRISADEIVSRLQKFRESNIGLISSGANFTLNGRPLVNATVTLVPEPFLGSAFKSRHGHNRRQRQRDLQNRRRKRGRRGLWALSRRGVRGRRRRKRESARQIQYADDPRLRNCARCP